MSDVANGTQKARLLLLEDELNVGSTVSERLISEGLEVTWVKSKSEADKVLDALKIPFDLALLDVSLPDGNGFDVGMKLRKLHPMTAIVFLTAFGLPDDRVRGLELGAEDYIVKPFHFKELVLRLKNVLKRSRVPAQDDAVIGNAKFVFSRFAVVVGTQEFALSSKEAAFVRLFLENQGRTLSRDEILNTVWSPDEYPSPRTVDNFVVRVRKWIEPDPDNPVFIRSVRGVGYLLEKGEK